MAGHVGEEKRGKRFMGNSLDPSGPGFPADRRSPVQPVRWRLTEARDSQSAASRPSAERTIMAIERMV